jgi:RNase H-like domain found in reverse transcriptase
MAAHNLVTKVGRPYLIGRPVNLYIDQKALKYLMSQTQVRARQAKWILDLQEFDLRIEHIAGETNKLADLLSRNLMYAPRCIDCKKNADEEQLLLMNTFDVEEYRNRLGRNYKKMSMEKKC